MRYFIVILIIGLFAISRPTSLEAQSDSLGVSENSFKELKKEIEYNKTKKTLVPKTIKKKERELELTPSNPGIRFGAAGLLQGFAYLLIAGLILFILYFVISGIKVKSRIDHTTVELSEIENIEEIDAVTGYDQALADGNYRLALRMQFIKVLQTLSAKDFIQWKPDKTNRHYIRETSGKDIHHTFRSLAQTYEWVWYGNSAIGKETFDQLNPKFETFNNKTI